MLAFLKDKRLLLIICTSGLVIMSFWNIFDFYFWHDDYTHLYKAQNGILSFFPYQFFSVINPFLYRIFGLTPKYYFIFGTLLYWVSALLLYELARIIFENKYYAFLTSILFSAGYIGQGSLIMFPGDGAGTLPILPLVILMFILYIKKLKNNSNSLMLSVFFLLFVILELAPHRYVGLLPILLSLELVYLFFRQDKKKYLKHVLTRSMVFIGMFYLEYSIRPTNAFWGGSSTISGSSKMITFVNEISLETVLMQLANFWNFIFPAYIYEALLEILRRTPGSIFRNRDALVIIQAISGLGLVVFTALILVFNKRKSNIFIAIAFLTGLSTFLIAAPNMHISSDYRYFMAYSFVSVIFLVAVLSSLGSKKTLVTVLITPLVVLRLWSAIQSQRSFMENYVVHFKNIYSQLKVEVPEISKPTLIYIEGATKQLNSVVGDASRVGELPTQAAFAVHYNVPMDLIILPETEDEIPELIKIHKLERANIYKFKYDGHLLEKI